MLNEEKYRLDKPWINNEIIKKTLTHIYTFMCVLYILLFLVLHCIHKHLKLLPTNYPTLYFWNIYISFSLIVFSTLILIFLYIYIRRSMHCFLHAEGLFSFFFKGNFVGFICDCPSVQFLWLKL